MSYQIYCHEICPLVKSDLVTVSKNSNDPNEVIRTRILDNEGKVLPTLEMGVPRNLKDGIDVSKDAPACESMIDRYGYALRRELHGCSGGTTRCRYLAKPIFAAAKCIAHEEKKI